jgi:hypothetical protein
MDATISSILSYTLYRSSENSPPPPSITTRKRKQPKPPPPVTTHEQPKPRSSSVKHRKSIALLKDCSDVLGLPNPNSDTWTVPANMDMYDIVSKLDPDITLKVLIDKIEQEQANMNKIDKTMSGSIRRIQSFRVKIKNNSKIPEEDGYDYVEEMLYMFEDIEDFDVHYYSQNLNSLKNNDIAVMPIDMTIEKLSDKQDGGGHLILVVFIKQKDGIKSLILDGNGKERYTLVIEEFLTRILGTEVVQTDVPYFNIAEEKETIRLMKKLGFDKGSFNKNNEGSCAFLAFAYATIVLCTRTYGTERGESHYRNYLNRIVNRPESRRDSIGDYNYMSHARLIIFVRSLTFAILKLIYVYYGGKRPDEWDEGIPWPNNITAEKVININTQELDEKLANIK